MGDAACGQRARQQLARDQGGGPGPRRRLPEVLVDGGALPSVPDAKSNGDLHEAGSGFQERLKILHRRVLGRPVTIAEAVEKTLGLAPIPFPEV